jgi:ATP-dependent DNA helicase DinG
MPPAKTVTARQFFHRGGVLSKWHPNYEFRQGQLDMAEAVESAILDRKHLIVEAGTGTGKTLAYLVPAILSGKRVVVSTGTKNLQEQLFYKDVPFLQQHFDQEIKVCLMKGRNNFACRQKIYDAEREPILSGLEEVNDFQIIREWEKTTETGDRAEIKQLPEDSTAWAKIDARRETCTGSKCLQYERCFLTAMHQRAHESDIVIVNHHLFFADLAVREEDFGGIIPDYAAVIFDEAHEIEEVAGSYFGAGISNYQVLDLVRDVNAVARRKNVGSNELDRILIGLQDLSDSFFLLFPHQEGRSGFTAQRAFLDQHGEHYRDLLIAFELLETTMKLIHNAPEELIPLVRRTRFLADALKFWMESGSRELVYWIERRGRAGVFLQATPIDVSSILAERLFNQLDTIVLTSATIAVSGSFDFAQKRLGLKGNRAQLVASPFDYEKQALLYIPQHLPDPRTPDFGRAAAEEIIDLLTLSEGRAFVLFTSYTQMKLAYERVSMRIPYESLLQGTGPRNALLEEFKNTPNCVLFATYSFWQGVDVPGEQLSCVIIDKLPFAVPSDPIVEARVALIREQGGNPFYDYQIPQAAIALKQGFGRLIRGKSDRGVLALLDHRITKQRYGQIFFDSLPDYAFTVKKTEVEKFFECLK